MRVTLLVQFREVPLQGLLRLVVDGLPRSVRLINATGQTREGSPFVTVNANRLQPKKPLQVVLGLKKPAGLRLRFSTRILDGVGVV